MMWVHSGLVEVLITQTREFALDTMGHTNSESDDANCTA